MLLMTQVTMSPLLRAEELNVALLAPAFEPLIFHWYDGDAPPPAGLAVKVAAVPEQIVFPGLTAIVTDAAVDGVTIRITLLLAVVVIPPQVVVVVSSQLTESPAAGVVSV